MEENNSQRVREFMQEDMRRMLVTLAIVLAICVGLFYLQKKTGVIEKLFTFEVASPNQVSTVQPTPTTEAPQ